MWRWFFLGLSACSFQHGSLAGGTGSDDAQSPDDDAAVVDTRSIDAPPDAACLAKWRAGPSFTTPAMLYGVATTGDEADPFLTADEKTIYFVRSSDIYRGTRASITLDTFSNVAKASDLSSGAGDSKVSMTEDGLTAFLNSSRAGGSGMTDVWRATRASVTATFETPDQKYLVAVNTSGDQWDPHISANGLRLYIAPPASPMQHIEMASRESLDDDFGAPVALTQLDSGQRDNDPTLTADERLIVFASNRNGDRNLWYALRDDPTQPFGAPIVVPQINTHTDDGPHLSHDGCRLYFTSDRDGDVDVWVTEVQ